ncbi:MAG TPA: AAA family ATPase [Actinomycetes bacterium]|jgi:DNA-binding CsgD family transcriptional regulator
MATAPFLGRDEELAALSGLVSRSFRAGTAAAAIVRGHAGSGKTRLIMEVRANLEPANQLTVSGFEPERQVPLAAARGLLSAMTSVEHEGSRLAALLDASSSGRPLEPVQVFEAAHRCVTELAPLVVLVDDLQWVDDLTVALAHYLLRAARHRGGGLALIAASRPGPAVSAFARSVGRLLADPDRMVNMTLGPLDRGCGVQLARCLNSDLDPASAARIWQQSGGVPFWLTELARAGTIGSITRPFLMERLAGVSADAGWLAAILATVGTPTDMAMIEDVLGWSQPRVHMAADELVNDGFAMRVGLVLRIVHDLVREAVLAELPDGLVRRAHAQLADHLEAHAGDDVQLLREALGHRRAAGRPCSDLALRLVSSPRRRLLGPEDVRELARVADDPAEAAAQSSQLRWEVARIASELGRPELALEHWVALLPRLTSADERARAALRASQAALQLGDWTQARALFAEACAAGSVDAVLAIELDAYQSELVGDSSTESELPMRRAASAARALVHSRGDHDALAADERRAYLAALRSQFYFALRTEQPEKMLHITEQTALACDTVDGRLRATLDGVLALRLLGQFVEAERRCRAARLAAVRENLPATAFHAGYLLAGTLYHLGRLAEARAAAAEVVAVADRAPVVVPTWLSQSWIRSLVHEIDVSMQGWQTSRAAIEDLADSEPNPHFRLNVRLTSGFWAARLGGPTDTPYAVACLKAAREDAQAAGCARCASELAVRAAEAYARVGWLGDARALLDTWDAGHPKAIGEVAFWRRRGEALITAHSDRAAAVAHLEAVCGQARSMSAQLEHVWSRLDLGKVLAVTDRERSVAVLQATAEDAHQLGAYSEQRRALQLLRAVGVRAWRPTRHVVDAGPGGLTERELEIGRMVATGASNPEIAEAMFVSRKTIERHVSNILAKTGTRNRAELAAHLASK